jgi:outer membrane protein assembly factor BamA
VEVIGYRRLTETDVRSHIKMRAGQLFTQERSRRDLQDLLATGLFNMRQTRLVTEPGMRGGVVVIFEVVEMPLILNVTITGLRGIEQSDIMSALRAKRINLVKDAVYDPVKVRAARRLIEELLVAHGWPDATVTDTEELGDIYISIVFEAATGND